MIKRVFCYSKLPKQMCPFCGHEHDEETFDFVIVQENSERGEFYCECQKCGARGPVMRFANTAIDAWNNTPDVDPEDVKYSYKNTLYKDRKGSQR